MKDVNAILPIIIIDRIFVFAVEAVNQNLTPKALSGPEVLSLLLISRYIRNW